MVFCNVVGSVILLSSSFMSLLLSFLFTIFSFPFCLNHCFNSYNFLFLLFYSLSFFFCSFGFASLHAFTFITFLFIFSLYHSKKLHYNLIFLYLIISNLKFSFYTFVNSSFYGNNYLILRSLSYHINYL